MDKVDAWQGLKENNEKKDMKLRRQTYNLNHFTCNVTLPIITTLVVQNQLFLSRANIFVNVFIWLGLNAISMYVYVRLDELFVFAIL